MSDKPQLTWKEPNPGADWPVERYRAKGATHDYRIIRDPAGEHIIQPTLGPKDREWWVLIIQEKDSDPSTGRAPTLLSITANHTLDWAQQDANRWENMAPNS